MADLRHGQERSGEEKSDAFPPTLDAMMVSGLVTLEKVQVLQYGETRNGKD